MDHAVSTGAPCWKRAFDAGEGAVGPRLGTLVRTNAFAETLRVSLQVQAELGRRLELASRTLLHTLNLPSGSDVRRLRLQLADVDRQLRALRDELEPAAPDGVT
jgi:hypothetical protein